MAKRMGRMDKILNDIKKAYKKAIEDSHKPAKRRRKKA